MKIIANICIGNSVHLKKEYKSKLIPVAGMRINDSVWDEPREILSVTIDPENEYYSLEVKDETAASSTRRAELTKNYESCGWEISSR